MIMGGLRAGNTQAMRQEDKDYIRNAWTRVNAATGQPFDHAFFDREGFVYDTEPACRAVVTVRKLKPQLALPFKARDQSSLLCRKSRHDRRPTRSCGSPKRRASTPGVSRHDSWRQTRATRLFRDFLIAKDMGVEGFPCLAVGNENEGYALDHQWLSPDRRHDRGHREMAGKSGAVLQRGEYELSAIARESNRGPRRD